MLPKPPQAAYQINRDRLSCKCIQTSSKSDHHWLFSLIIELFMYDNYSIVQISIYTNLQYIVSCTGIINGEISLANLCCCFLISSTINWIAQLELYFAN